MDKLRGRRGRAGPWPEHDSKNCNKKRRGFDTYEPFSHIYNIKFTVYITYIFTPSENARVDLV